jgi:hypothetical protein
MLVCLLGVVIVVLVLCDALMQFTQDDFRSLDQAWIAGSWIN